MATNSNEILNHAGSKYTTRSGTVRASRVEIYFKGVPITVDYTVDGMFLEATDIDDKCTPTATVLAAEIGGVDVGALLDFSDLEAALERTWELGR